MTIKSKFLYLVILTALIFQVSKFYSFYTEYSGWQYVDWLINYQGGFVRRGLVGEFLFQIHNIINIDLDILIFTFESLSNIAFAKLTSPQKTSKILIYSFMIVFTLNCLEIHISYTDNLSTHNSIKFNLSNFHLLERLSEIILSIVFL